METPNNNSNLPLGLRDIELGDDYDDEETCPHNELNACSDCENKSNYEK